MDKNHLQLGSLPTVSTRGQSNSIVASRAASAKVFDKFQAYRLQTHQQETGNDLEGCEPFAELLAMHENPERTHLGLSVLTNTKVYDGLAYFLLHEYRIPAGQKNSGCALDPDTMVSYIRLILNEAANVYKKS